MGTLVVSALIAPIRKDTFDESDDPRHADSDYLAWFNAAQTQAAIYKPDISVANTAVQLVAGTRQSVPAAYRQLLRLVRNMGPAGSTPGRVIEFAQWDDFNRRNPFWHQADSSATVRFYLFKADDPGRFYVFPPQPASGCGYVDGVFCSAPTTIATVNNVITVDDIYAPVLEHYVRHRIALSDAAINPYAAAEAVAHWNLFAQGLGRMDLMRQTLSPKAQEAKE